MRQFRIFLGLLGTALALAACAGDKPAVPPAPPPPAAPPESEPAPRLEIPETAPAPRPRPRPSFDAKRFVGLAPAAVERMLGAPTLKQQETFAEVWQYVSGPCVLHLYFYRPKGAAADAPFKVEEALVETRPGPWGDNLRPEGICALEFSGRTPGKAQPAPARAAPSQTTPAQPGKKTIVPRPR